MSYYIYNLLDLNHINTIVEPFCGSCAVSYCIWYFVNVERGNVADKLQPRNINVSFTNNSNVPIDVIIFTFYSDQLTIDVETGIVTK